MSLPQYRQLNSQTPLPPPLQLSDRQMSLLQSAAYLPASQVLKEAVPLTAQLHSPTATGYGALPLATFSLLLTRCKRKPNKLPILQNLGLCLLNAATRQTDTPLLCFSGLSQSGISFLLLPGLRFTTRKTTTSGSPFSTTMHVILHDC